MTTGILERLRCPVCGVSGDVDENGKSFYCKGARRHSFDFSKSGYLNLCLNGKTGDRREAVRARSLFLEAGYYQSLSEEINRILEECKIGSVLDAGCGEGYYTNRMATGRTVFGADLSRCGIDYAAKTAKRMGNGAAFAVASLYTLPVADASFDAVTNLFAPCAEAEFARVLKDGGYLILVGAGERHLMGLKTLIYDHPYTNPGRNDLPVKMTLVRKTRLHQTVTVCGEEMLEALFSMTPYYWRTSEGNHAKLRGVSSLETEIDFDIFLYRKEGN